MPTGPVRVGLRPRAKDTRERSFLTPLLVTIFLVTLLSSAFSVQAAHQVWVNNPTHWTVDANWHQFNPHANLKVGGYNTWKYLWCWNVVGQPQSCGPGQNLEFTAIWVPRPDPGYPGICIWSQPEWYKTVISGLSPGNTYEFRMMIYLAMYEGGQPSCQYPKLKLPIDSELLGNFCIVTNACRATTPPCPPAGCFTPPKGGSPRVAVFTPESTWADETNVLPQSESYEGPSPPDWEDALQITSPANSTGANYSFIIREDQTAQNSFDQITLSTVDFASGYSVAISPTGDVHSYSDPSPPLTAVNSLGQSVLSLVEAPDSHPYRGWDGDYVTASFGPIPGGGGSGMLSMGGSRQKLVLSSRDDVPSSCNCWKQGIPIETQSGGLGWQTVAVVYPRLELRVQIVDLTGLFPTGSIDIRLQLSEGHELDWIALEDDEDITLAEVETPPQEILYSNGQAANLTSILYDDGIYAALAPGQDVYLRFQVASQSAVNRVLILRLNGYYTSP